MLAEDASDPALNETINRLAAKTQGLLDISRPFSGEIRDLRLALEVGAIQRLAESLTARLKDRDPLSEETHHSRWEALGVGLLGVTRTIQERMARQAAPAVS